MMSLELIPEFDPFLAGHIASSRNPGSGKISYLSSSICNELMDLMALKTKGVIVDEIRQNKYFAIITDSTPDIGHVDQLSFIVRYIQNNGVPVERFLGFLPNVGH